MSDFANKARFTGCRGLRNSPTGNALLCQIDGREVWIPHSQIDDDSEVYAPGGEGELVVSEWIAIQKGLV